MNVMNNDVVNIEALYDQIAEHIKKARSNVLRAVNHEQVIAYWHIGKHIVMEEQKGQDRQQYGTYLIKQLSEKLTRHFGRGFSISNLKYIRQFYLTYHNRISHEARDQSQHIEFNPNLSWTHYRLLMSESRPSVRDFYEIEAAKNHWSTPQLERQMTSFLYERLAASKDEKGLIQLANHGQVIETPEDALKSPVVLDFLGYKEHHQYTESDLESAILDHLQEFLLEMGKGFAFVSRQKRITMDGEYFRPDLVFYHTILKAYCIIDIKAGKRINHGDVGQMMMYVNYYDREIKQSDDNPTIGLLLCAGENEAAVKYTLPEDNKQIFARKYQFHLPTQEELKVEIQREYQEMKKLFNQDNEGNL
ncbi:PDDEXK nuclease domain-containing protein [Cysteiniphilum litorale]|uniref:PDDEXK nuclease domain-containing protein n=1 Tax=Cysteiniphilum litorale TaxID=2056700 RepID=UPI003F882A27